MCHHVLSRAGVNLFMHLPSLAKSVRASRQTCNACLLYLRRLEPTSVLLMIPIRRVNIVDCLPPRSHPPPPGSGAYDARRLDRRRSRKRFANDWRLSIGDGRVNRRITNCARRVEAGRFKIHLWIVSSVDCCSRTERRTFPGAFAPRNLGNDDSRNDQWRTISIGKHRERASNNWYQTSINNAPIGGSRLVRTDGRVAYRTPTSASRS